MISTDWTPTANHLLISIPSRYHAPQGPRSPDGLALTVISGEDAMHELEAQIKRGGKLQIETETDTSIHNLVRVGQVLQIPLSLNDQMYLCAAGESYRTYADITPVVEVGDTVYLDHSCLTDENEILPGIYRVPYAAVICVIHQFTFDKNPHNGGHYTELDCLVPVGGYVLLSRVWADDVTDYELDDRMQKVRWNAAGTLIAEYNVPPLANEGRVAWIDAPLKGALNELHPGQRVLITKGQALTETIAGTEYLCIRHDYVLGIREHESVGLLRDYLRNTPAEELQADWDAVSNVQPEKQNPFTKEFQRLPLTHPSYNA